MKARAFMEAEEPGQCSVKLRIHALEQFGRVPRPAVRRD